MNKACIRYHKEGPLVTITLNRPRVLNAMNRQLWIELQAGLEDAAADDSVKVLILTGQGRAFSSGADLKESKGRSMAAYRLYLTQLQETTRKILRFEKPIIAAINGYALGSGYELSLACDLRIAAEEAAIGSPEVRVSSSVTGGALRLLPALVGPAKAKELLFSGENIDGKTAQQIGLVNRAVPLAELMSTAREMALKIAQNSSFSIKMIKKGLHLAQGETSLEALMEYEIEACLACVSTLERETALATFEHRKNSR